MRTHVALLRGINVGGHNKVAMSDLREIMLSLGHTDVVTYIQSGNVVFTSADTDSAKLASSIEREIGTRLSVWPTVVVLSRADLAQVIADNPYPAETDPKRLHAMFRLGDASPELSTVVATAQRRARDAGSPDEACVVGRTVFLRTPDGLGRSDLAAQLGRSATSATTRNWATVTRLQALLDD